MEPKQNEYEAESQADRDAEEAIIPDITKVTDLRQLKVTPTIADDIELLIQVALSNKEGGTKEVEEAAYRVEAYLATYRN